MVSRTGRSSARRRSDGDHGVVRLTALEVDVRRQRRAVRHHGCELRHQRDPGRDVVADQRRQGGRRGVEDGRAERVDERLEEERALRGVAAAAQDAAAGGGGQVGHARPGSGSCRCRPRPRRAPAPACSLRRAPPRRARPGRARARGRRAGSARRAVLVGASAGRSASRSTETCRSTLSRSGDVPSSSRSRAARSSYAARAALARPSATSARIRVRTACSSNGSAATLSAATRAAPAGSSRSERLGEQVPGAAAQAVGLAAHAQHPVGVVLVDEGGLAAEQLERRAGRGHGERRARRRQPGPRPRR